MTLVCKIRSTPLAASHHSQHPTNRNSFHIIMHNLHRAHIPQTLTFISTHQNKELTAVNKFALIKKCIFIILCASWIQKRNAFVIQSENYQQ